jgi:hypothetical protein
MLYIRHTNTIITERSRHTLFQHSLFRFTGFNKTLFGPAVLKLCSADPLGCEATLKFTSFLIKDIIFL